MKIILLDDEKIPAHAIYSFLKVTSLEATNGDLSPSAGLVLAG
jgi:hypothetical protein